MKKEFLIVAFCAVLLPIGCARTGSSSSEQTQQTDSQAITSQLSPDTAGNQSAPLVPVEVPNVPTPEPLGWEQFDEFYQQLLAVHQHVITDSVPGEDATQLMDRAEKLAGDKTKEREQSAPIRQMLVDRVREFNDVSKVPASAEQSIEVFRHVLLVTQSIVPTDGATPQASYSEKLQSMMIEIENRLMQVRANR